MPCRACPSCTLQHYGNKFLTLKQIGLPTSKWFWDVGKKMQIERERRKKKSVGENCKCFSSVVDVKSVIFRKIYREKNTFYLTK